MGLDQPNQSVLAEVLGQNKAISSQSQFVKWRNSNDMARREEAVSSFPVG